MTSIQTLRNRSLFRITQAVTNQAEQLKGLQRQINENFEELSYEAFIQVADDLDGNLDQLRSQLREHFLLSQLNK